MELQPVGNALQPKVAQITKFFFKKMKILNIIILLFAVQTIKAQVAINRAPSNNNSVSIEFGEQLKKGLVLPYVLNEGSTVSPVDGTIIFDQSTRKVKYRRNGVWTDLSINPDTTDLSSTFAVQNDETENANAKVSIGTPSSVVGILVLEDNNKAMVLPKEDSPHANIKNPAPGMMVYDTASKQLAVYNGTVWTYWRATN